MAPLHISAHVSLQWFIVEAVGNHTGNPQFWHYAAWTQALIATLGSLFFSEVMKLPPCVLCWYQRIAMYPLVVILAVGAARRDRGAALYGLPLAIVGLAIAVYHNLLYYHVIPESLTPCTSGVSCTSRQLEWAGFVTIPLLSLAAFVVVTTCLAIGLRKSCEERA